jgi:hypothetical protein
MKKLVLAGFLLGLLGACSRPESRKAAVSAASPSPSTLADAYDREIQADDTSEVRMEVRRLVIAYLKNAHPKWQVRGLSLTHYDGEANYYVGVDVTRARQP